MSKPNDYDTYIIPPNFIEGGTFFGGLLKLRNTAEALVIVLAIGMPVFSVSALTLTAKIIILCLTALPLGIIALVGINGESLSSLPASIRAASLSVSPPPPKAASTCWRYAR